MKWFFALNEVSLKNSRSLWEPMILVALSSAQKNTNLKPYLIFDGGEDPFIARLEKQFGVTVVRHRVSFYDKLVDERPDDPGYLSIASGAFLRTEIPLVEREDEFVLYTDCDVMFKQQVDLDSLRPVFFACAPEFDKADLVTFNTGVMLMNLPALREDLPTFTDYIGKNLDNFVTFDQDAYRLYYKGRVDPLPLELNWKPYWGASASAQIVHFHGPKPSYAVHLLAHPDDMSNSSLHTIFHWNVAGYVEYVKIWDGFKDAIQAEDPIHP